MSQCENIMDTLIEVRHSPLGRHFTLLCSLCSLNCANCDLTAINQQQESKMKKKAHKVL
jgi:hypothetical protein